MFVKCSSCEPVGKKRRVDPFAELRDGASSSSGNSADSGPQLSGREELARYKALQVPTETAGPLEFWRQQADYPVMSQTARRVLAISASSAQSERDFSSVGHTLTELRTRLAPEKVEAIELVRWGKHAGLLPPM